VAIAMEPICCFVKGKQVSQVRLFKHGLCKMVVEDNLFVLGGFNILLVLFEVFSQFTLY
jgi:hypothetical protein